MLCGVVRHVALEFAVVDAVEVHDCEMLVLNVVLNSVVVVASVGAHHFIVLASEGESGL